MVVCFSLVPRRGAGKKGASERKKGGYAFPVGKHGGGCGKYLPRSRALRKKKFAPERLWFGRGGGEEEHGMDRKCGGNTSTKKARLKRKKRRYGRIGSKHHVDNSCPAGKSLKSTNHWLHRKRGQWPEGRTSGGKFGRFRFPFLAHPGRKWEVRRLSEQRPSEEKTRGKRSREIGEGDGCVRTPLGGATAGNRKRSAV